MINLRTGCDDVVLPLVEDFIRRHGWHVKTHTFWRGVNGCGGQDSEAILHDIECNPLDLTDGSTCGYAQVYNPKGECAARRDLLRDIARGTIISHRYKSEEQRFEMVKEMEAALTADEPLKNEALYQHDLARGARCEQELKLAADEPQEERCADCGEPLEQEGTHEYLGEPPVLYCNECAVERRKSNRMRQECDSCKWHEDKSTCKAPGRYHKVLVSSLPCPLQEPKEPEHDKQRVKRQAAEDKDRNTA